MAKTETKHNIIDRWPETYKSANGKKENIKSANKNIKVKKTYTWG